MTEELSQTTQTATPAGAEETVVDGNPARLVPVGESIRYRRRAQQAEGRLSEMEQQLQELKTQVEAGRQQYANLETQRDDAQRQLVAVNNRMAAERMLGQAGVVDIEVAAEALSRKVNYQEALEPQKLADSVRQLLSEKPYLQGSRPAELPSKTASARSETAGPTAILSQAAQRASRSGDRRDLAEYLRLRRQAAK